MIQAYLGDCLYKMKYIAPASVDLIFTDLPYGTTKCAWDVRIPFKPLWKQYWRILKPNSAILLFAQTPFDKVAASSCLQYYRYEWIWEKPNATGHLNAKKMPLKAHENILVFYKSLPVYNPQMTTGHKRKTVPLRHRWHVRQSELYGQEKRRVGYDSTERYPRSVLRFPSDKQKLNLHPAQKPVALCEYMIKTYTNPGAVVLDSCAGSGTVGEAAENTGRDSILIEIDPVFWGTIQNRLF